MINLPAFRIISRLVFGLTFKVFSPFPFQSHFLSFILYSIYVFVCFFPYLLLLSLLPRRILKKQLSFLFISFQFCYINLSEKDAHSFSITLLFSLFILYSNSSDSNLVKNIVFSYSFQSLNQIVFLGSFSVLQAFLLDSVYRSIQFKPSYLSPCLQMFQFFSICCQVQFFLISLRFLSKLDFVFQWLLLFDGVRLHFFQITNKIFIFPSTVPSNLLILFVFVYNL